MKRQVDYNKIASNISKYSFDFDLSVDETYENFSKEYPEIYTIFSLLKTDLINLGAIDNPTPFFIQDNQSPSGAYLVNDVALTQQNNILTIIGIQANNNLNDVVNFEFNFNKDTLIVNTTQEEFLTLDNVKSVFNQSITGTGNITLFRHKLTISDMSSTGIRGVILDYLSTNNLNVDSLQDLQTLLDVSRNDTSDTTFLGYLGVHNYTITYKYSNGLFVLSDGTTEYNATSVSDKVKPM